MNKITAIIVDDEARARTVLNRLLGSSNPEIEVKAECSNLLEAVDCIKEHKPSVVFLDVHMPKFAGYEIVNFFDVIDFEIIFVTAFDHYAIHAFELNAMDYLVKPIERERLSNTITKLKNRLEIERKSVEYELLLSSIQNKSTDKIIIPELGNRRIVEVAHIQAIEANGSYTKFHMYRSENFIVSKNLKYFEDRLGSDNRFFRTHRTYMVNLEFIQSVNKKDYTLTLQDDLKVKLSRNRFELLKKRI